MQLQARILEVKVEENTRYHEKTGAPDPSYYLEATVVDFSIKEPQVYHCSFRNIPEVDQLRQAYKDKWPIAEREALRQKIQAEAKQEMENQEKDLIVLEIDWKFKKLLVTKA